MARNGVGRRREAAPSGSDRPTNRPAAAVPLTSRVRERVTQELNSRKDRASELLDTFASTVRRIGEPLHVEPVAGLGEYADEAAARLEHLASGIRERDVGELADELRGVARRRPAAYAAAGFAVGLLAARFLRSSAAIRPRLRGGLAGRGGVARRVKSAAADQTTSTSTRIHDASPAVAPGATYRGAPTR